MRASTYDAHPVPLATGPMLLGVVAAAAAPVVPPVADLACRLADPFLAALVGVAHWAAGLPAGPAELTGPARLAPAAVAAALVALAHRRARALDRRAAERRLRRAVQADAQDLRASRRARAPVAGHRGGDRQASLADGGGTRAGAGPGG